MNWNNLFNFIKEWGKNLWTFFEDTALPGMKTRYKKIGRFIHRHLKPYAIPGLVLLLIVFVTIISMWSSLWYNILAFILAFLPLMLALGVVIVTRNVDFIRRHWKPFAIYGQYL